MFLIIPFLIHIITYWTVANPHEMNQKSIYSVLFNQFILTPTIGWSLSSHIPANNIFYHFYPIYIQMIQFIGLVIIEEILFYYIHFAFHSRILYKYHKQHHQWTYPIAGAAIDARPVEYICIDLLPILIGSILVQCDCILLSLWIFLVTINTLYSHHPSSTLGFHYTHHIHSNVNYSVFGIMDYLHQTYQYDISQTN